MRKERLFTGDRFRGVQQVMRVDRESSDVVAGAVEVQLAGEVQKRFPTPFPHPFSAPRSDYDAHDIQANRENHDVVHGERLPRISVPKLRIEGTQSPTNIPSSLFPENQR